MKRFSAPSTERTSRTAFSGFAMACLVSALALATASCVSDPEPAAGPTETAVAVTPERPVIVESMRAPAPVDGVVSESLAEPGIPEPAAAVVPVEPVPTDITVLSAAPVISFDAVQLPEPMVPAARVVPAVKPAPVATPAPAKPAAATPKPAIATPAPAKPAIAPKTEEADPEGVAPTAELVDAAPVVALPPTPASSARSVTAAERPVAETRIETARGERFELRFPGTGWIFLGDEDGKEGLRYETRRFEDAQAVFSLDPERAGEYLLRFQRQNPVDRAIETSLVRVVVTEKPSDTASTQGEGATSAARSAASSPAIVPASPAPASTPAIAPAAAPTAPTAAAMADPAVPAAAGVSDPAALLRLAKAELEAKRVQSALEALDRYLTLYPYGNDEVFYLYGLAYEQDTPFRNIKKAYEYYKRVKDEYPRSARWREASERVAYLERHYFGLR